MELKEVTFNTAADVLILTFWDGVNEQPVVSETFTGRAELVARFPEYDRFADGMGWV